MKLAITATLCLLAPAMAKPIGGVEDGTTRASGLDMEAQYPKGNALPDKAADPSLPIVPPQADPAFSEGPANSREEKSPVNPHMFGLGPVIHDIGPVHHDMGPFKHDVHDMIEAKHPRTRFMQPLLNPGPVRTICFHEDEEKLAAGNFAHTSLKLDEDEDEPADGDNHGEPDDTSEATEEVPEYEVSERPISEHDIFEHKVTKEEVTEHQVLEQAPKEEPTPASPDTPPLSKREVEHMIKEDKPPICRYGLLVCVGRQGIYLNKVKESPEDGVLCSDVAKSIKTLQDKCVVKHLKKYNQMPTQMPTGLNHSKKDPFAVTILSTMECSNPPVDGAPPPAPVPDPNDPKKQKEADYQKGLYESIYGDGAEQADQYLYDDTDEKYALSDWRKLPWAQHNSLSFIHDLVHGTLPQMNSRKRKGARRGRGRRRGPLPGGRRGERPGQHPAFEPLVDLPGYNPDDVVDAVHADGSREDQPGDVNVIHGEDSSREGSPGDANDLFP